MTDCKIQFFETNHRYKIDGRYATSVTTALKGIPKDALPRWAARTVASHALNNISTLADSVEAFGFEPALRMLAGVPDEKRDTAAIRGTDVHNLAEPYLAGEKVEVPAELEPYVRGYARYVEDWNPTAIYDEVIVASRKHNYAGRLDSIQDIPGLGVCLVDYKTSNRIYGEHALQCAAYRYAETMVVDGEEIPMPPVERVLILHIQPETYDLIPAEAGPETFEKFLTAKANYLANVQSGKLKKLIGEPLVREVA
ncbi:hypothetical protein DMH01_03485 [Amycolatopsis sp. WAC 04182]|uniref:hypothetical protein n=1 Tax=Amycolatopsis sp. WAC 04182 TaxID=2203198 RepID=UPI000F7802CA|nr:hypothetical protein [Amycolatopsis sp. WAC 04182]RSN65452.1 hypothetical protein DMH01_03485 [Amycolatopsis sp. WAC 04182]